MCCFFQNWHQNFDFDVKLGSYQELSRSILIIMWRILYNKKNSENIIKNSVQHTKHNFWKHTQRSEKQIFGVKCEKYISLNKINNNDIFHFYQKYFLFDNNLITTQERFLREFKFDFEFQFSIFKISFLFGFPKVEKKTCKNFFRRKVEHLMESGFIICNETSVPGFPLFWRS